MPTFILILIIFMIVFELIAVTVAQSMTATYITTNNYPVEEHNIRTTDDYILTIFRIPDSPKRRNGTDNANNSTSNAERKPAILLQHGFVLTSDAWVLTDPTTSLAFLLADAGYDVWLGNQRGNTYSRAHATLDTDDDDFWDFSWHEIGYYDLAAMMDYVLEVTQQTGLHYVGYSQGTSALLVLLSTRPSYNERLHTTHLLAPVAFLQRIQQPLAIMNGALLEAATLAVNTFGHREVLHYARQPLFRRICELLCGDGSLLQFVCTKLYQLIGGPGVAQPTGTLIGDICATHPAGASSKQILHFLQLYKSDRFQQYDYGAVRNLQLYAQDAPPAYDFSQIVTCIELYYSRNDYLSAAADVERLAQALPCAHLQRMKHPNWNHYDFLWAQDVKQALNDRIIEKIKRFEEKKI